MEKYLLFSFLMRKPLMENPYVMFVLILWKLGWNYPTNGYCN